MKFTMIAIALLIGCLLAPGCVVVTQDQKDWIQDKASRSAAFVALMDKGQTDRTQEQAWIYLQDQSWRLWSQKIDLGLAAPNWMADAKKQAATQPAAQPTEPARPNPQAGGGDK